jgi:integration host factor subunit beta
VTKKEIVKQISERSNLTQMRTKEIVQWTFDAIIEALEQDGRIELRNFGVFEVKTRKARTARNPKTDEEVEVPEKNVVTFQPGKVMEEKVRKALSPSQRQARKRTEKSRILEPVLIGGPDSEDFDEPEFKKPMPKKPR